MDFRRLYEIFTFQKTHYPQKIALATRKGEDWQTFNTDQCLNYINQVSAGLLNLGLTRGDKVAIMSRYGSPYWNFLDFGMQQIGVITVPLHATANIMELEYILNDASVKYCFVSTPSLYDKINMVRPNVASLVEIYSLSSEKKPNILHWDDLLIRPNNHHIETFQNLRAAIHEDDLATIIYTSGTTGNPKGVMLSHKNIVSNIKAIISLVPVNHHKRTLSFLPLSHVFERMVTYTYMAVGASVYYVNDLENILTDIQDVQPHYFTSVPRFLEKIYDGILKTGATKSKFSQRILHWAIKIGKRYKERTKISWLYWLQLRFANILVFRKWRQALGGHVEGVVVGAAALRPQLGRLFSAAGIEIREGYGLTETSPVVAFNRFEPGGVRFGTVGIAIPGVEIKIDNPNEEGEGEILIQGPNVMLGYYQLDELTRKVIDKDNWFHTGDIGKFVHKKFLKITDRSKDIFKTSHGKYIAPQVLENKLKNSAYVEQCMIVGFQRPFVSAIIFPNMSLLQQWCENNNVHWTAPQFMVINPKVVAFMEAEVNRVNEDLSSHQKIKKVHLIYEEWTPETGELTPTLKVKRPVVSNKYDKAISGLYS